MYIRLLCVLALSRCVVAGAIRSDNQQHGSRYFFDFFRPDAIVITANFSDEYENATDERSIRLGADKTKFYHNYEVFEPEFPNDEGKRIASRNNSVPSYVPWSPDPLAQLRFGSWAKKEVITTTVVVQVGTTTSFVINYARSNLHFFYLSAGDKIHNSLSILCNFARRS